MELKRPCTSDVLSFTRLSLIFNNSSSHDCHLAPGKKRLLLSESESMTSIRTVATLASMICFSIPGALAQSKIEHVLLISVDGLHEVDLAHYVLRHPKSALADLSSHGLTYSNAFTTMPSDSFPGLLALLTGGTPRTTGVWYDDAFANELSSPKSCKPGDKPEGYEYDYSEAIDVDDKSVTTTIDPAKLAADPAKNCAPVYPHSLVRVNNIFDVVKAAGKQTAWADKHPAYDLVQGPDGHAVTDLYTPEINGEGIPDSVEKTIAYDAGKAKAIVYEIKGLDHSGKSKADVPAVFGMNFQAVSVAQKNAGNGYLNADADPSPGLARALDATDAALGSIKAALSAEKLEATTLIVVTAKHGQSPIDPTKRQIVDGKNIKKMIEASVPGVVANVTTDSVALIWLKDKSKTAEVAVALEKVRTALSIDKLTFGPEMNRDFGDPSTDPRVPDIIIEPVLGVIYTKPTATKLAEHGGGSADDRHVALLVSNPALKATRIDSPVATKQVATSILRVLGLDPLKLDAVRAEGTAPLPGLVEMLAGH